MSEIIPLKNCKPTHPLRSLKTFADDADMLVSRHTELDDLPDIIRKKIATLTTSEQIDELFAEAKKTATLDQHDEAVLAQCNAALQRFDPRSAYEDDCKENNLKRSVIGERIAMLVGAFPNGAPSDPLVYVTMLINKVYLVDDLIMPALDAAVWEIIGTKKFLPAISEVLEIVNGQTTPWNERSWAIRDLADKSCRIVARIEEMEKKIKARQ